MCGILGLVTASGSPDRHQLERGAQLLSHRGPDSWGTYVAEGVGLAQTRLALLDLSERSSQPFWDSTGTSCLVYNGEIYNFKDLKARLQGEGRHFRTTGDTEVVLEAILTWGLERALSSFEGMFALAFWDSHTRELSLARDRFGIKPLFLLEEPDRSLFASEIQAFRVWTDLKADPRTVASFLYATGGPTRTRTFFQNVRPLDPGTVLTFSPGCKPLESRFSAIPDLLSATTQEELAASSDKDLVDRTEKLLAESVKRQLVADAPVGVLCSGGVDSSLILAIAAQTHQDLAAFHANVVGPTSELAAARKLATHLRIDLHVVEVRDEDFIDLLPKLTLHHGSPYHLNPHSVPFFRVSELIRDEGFKAVLSGEGADEAYLGYAWLAPGRSKNRSNNNPADPSRTYLAPVDGSRPGRFVRGRGISTAQAETMDLVTGMLTGFATEAEHEANARAVLGLLGRDRALASTQTLDLLNSNLRGLLHRNDTMGMAASIESRFPFLDEQLVADAVNLPARAKIRRGLNLRERQHLFAVDKWLLRKVADRYLPKTLSRRPKVPFATTAYNRMLVDPTLFVGGYVADEFGLARSEMSYLLEHAGSRLTSKLVHLEIWGRIFLTACSLDQATVLLKDNISLKPVH